jgi:hypothetical protein
MVLDYKGFQIWTREIDDGLWEVAVFDDDGHCLSEDRDFEDGHQATEAGKHLINHYLKFGRWL